MLSQSRFKVKGKEERKDTTVAESSGESAKTLAINAFKRKSSLSRERLQQLYSNLYISENDIDEDIKCDVCF